MNIISLIKYLICNLNENISLDDIEEIFHYNKYHIIRTFKEYTGFTITEFINYVKVLKSIDPLLFTNDTILKIALNNGFNSLEYYSETFKDVIGISPKKFKKEFSSLDNESDACLLKLKKNYIKELYNYRDYLLSLGEVKNNKVLKKIA